NQLWKNTAFGPMDIGVFLQQLLHAMQTGGPQAFLGLANRMAAAMKMPHVRVLNASSTLPKKLQYQLDGLGVGSGVRTGIVDIEKGGSLFGKIPKVGKYIDRAIDAKSDFEF